MKKKTKLVIMTGLPGTGKTTAAKLISNKIGGVLLRTDVLRKELFNQPTYSIAETEITFFELYKRTEKFLLENKNVVVDGVFAKQGERDSFKMISVKCRSSFKVIFVDCEEKTIQNRLKNRKNDESDATFEIYLMLKQFFEPVKNSHLKIDNSGVIENLEEQIDSLVI